MGHPAKIATARGEFISEIIAAMDLAGDVYDMLAQTDPSMKKPISKLRMEQIYELAFLKLILSWEAFLERTLVLYLMGKNRIMAINQ